MRAPRSTSAAGFALLLLLPLASANAAPTGDCATLKNAAAQYSKLADHLTALRKDAEQSAGDPSRLPWIQRGVAQQAREIAAVLQGLQEQLEKPELKELYADDATSFQEYADALDKSLGKNGDSVDIQGPYDRNVEAVNAANNAYHAQCGQ